MLDNTLLGERVLDPPTSARARWTRSTRGSRADERVESVLLGLSDGVTLAPADSTFAISQTGYYGRVGMPFRRTDNPSSTR